MAANATPELDPPALPSISVHVVHDAVAAFAALHGLDVDEPSTAVEIALLSDGLTRYLAQYAAQHAGASVVHSSAQAIFADFRTRLFEPTRHSAFRRVSALLVGALGAALIVSVLGACAASAIPAPTVTPTLAPTVSIPTLQVLTPPPTVAVVRACAPPFGIVPQGTRCNRGIWCVGRRKLPSSQLSRPVRSSRKSG